MTAYARGVDGSRRASWKHWLAGRSLRARLIAGLLVLFTLASVGVGVATTVAVHNFQLRQLDQQLSAAAHTFSVALENPDRAPAPQPDGCPGPRSGGEGPPSAAGQNVGTFTARVADGGIAFACRVTSSDGRIGLRPVRLSAEDLATISRLPLDQQPQSAHLSDLGGYRLSAFTGPDHDLHVTGLPLSGVQATVHELELIEVIVFGAALILMVLAGAGWIRYSLRPLGRIAATATEVSELPLESGEVTLPHRVRDADARTEVGKVGRAFNRMLGHVERSLATRQASEARLRQFIADASHELRTPLAGIRGYTEFAMRATGTVDPQVRHALGRVDAESARMSRLVDDLLLLARLDAGRPLADEPVDLTRLAIDATNDARIAGPDHRWMLDLPEEPVTVAGDVHRLHQVLANLLTNARVHTPAGSSVTLRVSRAESGPGVDLTVSDDGPGIPVELQSTVWERFARGDGARSRRAGSTGLGLAIVQAVVGAHHGRVAMESRPGRTTFRVWLPRDGSTAA